VGENIEMLKREDFSLVALCLVWSFKSVCNTTLLF